MVVKKNQFLPKHQHIEVPNLHVMKLMISLKSRGYVNEKFSWQWHYYTLTNEVSCAVPSVAVFLTCVACTGN